MTTAGRKRKKAKRRARARWAASALLAAPWVLLACGGHVRLSPQGGLASPDGGNDGSTPNGPTDSAAGTSEGSTPSGPDASGTADGMQAAGDAGCSDLLDAARTTISGVLGQYGSCQDAGDCTALPILGYCMVVSVAQSATFLSAASQASHGFEEAGCSVASISCDAVQLKCEGKCTAVGKLTMP